MSCRANPWLRAALRKVGPSVRVDLAADREGEAEERTACLLLSYYKDLSHGSFMWQCLNRNLGGVSERRERRKRYSLVLKGTLLAKHEILFPQNHHAQFQSRENHLALRVFAILGDEKVFESPSGSKSLSALQRLRFCCAEKV